MSVCRAAGRRRRHLRYALRPVVIADAHKRLIVDMPAEIVGHRLGVLICAAADGARDFPTIADRPLLMCGLHFHNGVGAAGLSR